MSERLDPHRPEERFRIYRLRRGELTCVCAVEHAEHVVGALIDQQDPESGATLEMNDRVGILDAQGQHEENPLDEFGCYTLPGYWVVNPWTGG